MRDKEMERRARLIQEVDALWGIGVHGESGYFAIPTHIINFTLFATNEELEEKIKEGLKEGFTLPDFMGRSILKCTE